VAAGQTAGPFFCRWSGWAAFPLPLPGDRADRFAASPAIALEIVGVVGETVPSAAYRRGPKRRPGDDAEVADAPPAVVLPAFCICLVLFRRGLPPGHRSATPALDRVTNPIVNYGAAVQGQTCPGSVWSSNAQRSRGAGQRRPGDPPAGRRTYVPVARLNPTLSSWPEDASEIDPLTNPRRGAADFDGPSRRSERRFLVGTVARGRRPDVGTPRLKRTR